MTVKTRLLSLFLLLSLAFTRLAAQAKIPVWIDTDPSLEQGVDDCFALIQAFHSPELEIRGVSAVFGNAPQAETWRTASEIVRNFGPEGLKAYKGATSSDDLGRETDASMALAQSLQQGPLNILAIGPVTNIATVLRLHPGLAKNIVQIIAVAGRRPGQRFAYGSDQAQSFQDFNFELDSAGFQLLLDSKVRITLAPWEISSKVWLKAEDVHRLEKGGPASKYLVQPSLNWLVWWRKNMGVDGFNPFDTLAVGYLTSPSLIHCRKVDVRIEYAPDDTAPAETAKTKPYLLASFEAAPSRTLLYCSEAAPQFKNDLMARLLSHPEKKESHVTDRR